MMAPGYEVACAATDPAQSNDKTRGDNTMTVASVQRDRLARRFELWDNDHSGTIERSDYEKEARDILHRFNEPEDSAKGRTLLGAYLQMWDNIAGQAGVGRNGSLDQRTFIDVVERNVLGRGDAGFSQIVAPTIKAIVDICDTDNDGEVDRREWKKWANAIGLTGPDADTAFDGIDTDHSGKLSVDELVQSVSDFHNGKTDVELLGGR